MSYVRWIVIVGIAIFICGLIFLLYQYNNRVGYLLGFIGFSLVLIGLVAGNWIASRLVENKKFARAHRVSVIGFCVSMVGVLATDMFPAVGSLVLILGLAVIFTGAITAMLAARE